VAGARRDTLDRPCYFEYSGEMFPTKIPAEFLPQRERERERERDARRELDPTARRCAESNLKEKFSCIAREAGRPLAFPIRDFDFPPIVEIEPLSLAELSPPLPLPLPPAEIQDCSIFLELRCAPRNWKRSPGYESSWEIPNIRDTCCRLLQRG